MTRKTGKALSRQYGVHASHALYRETGDWYHVLNAFPGVLFDAGGYLHFESELDYQLFIRDIDNLGVRQSLETNTLTVRQGIARHPAYVPFPPEISRAA